MSAVLPRPHRFDDPISAPNIDIYDTARGLVQAVALIDRLGIEVVTIQADRRRNQRVMVSYNRACDALEGVECQRTADWSIWTASRYGIEIRWLRPACEVAP